MHTKVNFIRLLGRTAALGVCVAGTAPFTFAQQASSLATPFYLAAAGAAADAVPAPASGTSSSSSSSPDASVDSMTESRFDLSSAGLDASQPPPRRRYGRPNYADSHTNADGSNKFAFMAGAGATVPTGDTANYLTPSYDFQVGAGRNWSKMYGLMVQFDYDHMGFQGATLTNQQNLYNSYCTTAQANAGNCSQVSGLDGTSHVWSFTLDPVITFYTGEKIGAYAVGGLGFYHKTANFTVPATGTYCDPYYGCYEYSANETIDKYTSNAIGYNGGLGLTYKPSRFAGERFYVEARYVFVDNSPKAATTTNLYPPNANQTYLVPVTVGLRF
jgi:hypothetical protein